jgi:diguanylate cyclase
VNDTRFDQLYTLTSIVSLVFQIAGTSLIALLSYVVSRAVRRRQMQYWALGWSCYVLALAAILFEPHVGPFGLVFYFAYYAFEYAAVLMIFAGCRYTALDRPIGPSFRIAFAAAAALAAIITALPAPFYWVFVVHTAIVGLLWASCLFALSPALRRPETGPGVRIVAAGLVLLSLDYLHHLPTALYFNAMHVVASPYYYTVESLVDGMFEFVLGFGTVVVIVDKVRGDLERANWQLKLAHDRTQDALHTDELTSAFSRYSFNETFVESKPVPIDRGCIVVADLDDLKEVNDTHGHAAGDAAIRAVATALGSMVRHEDRVYRFGGDEFVVVMPDMRIDALRQRLAGLDERVNRGLDASKGDIGGLSVSWGAADFGPGATINDALAKADAAMYAVKSGRKKSGRRS